MIQIFPGKSGRVTFLPLWMFNFMQKIGNIVWLEVSKFLGLSSSSSSIANIVRFRLNWTALEARDSTLVLWNDPEVDMHHSENHQFVKTTNMYRSMQYEVLSMNQTWENYQKLVKTVSFGPKLRYYWMIQMQNLGDTINKSWRPIRSINICNTKSTQWTKLEKMVKNWSKQVIWYQRDVIIEWST